jgi:hypothetical protein
VREGGREGVNEGGGEWGEGVNGFVNVGVSEEGRE